MDEACDNVTVQIKDKKKYTYSFKLPLHCYCFLQTTNSINFPLIYVFFFFTFLWVFFFQDPLILFCFLKNDFHNEQYFISNTIFFDVHVGKIFSLKWREVGVILYIWGIKLSKKMKWQCHVILFYLTTYIWCHII